MLSFRTLATAAFGSIVGRDISNSTALAEQQRKDYLVLKSLALMNRLILSSQVDWTGEMHAHPQENYYNLQDQFKAEDSKALNNLLAVDKIATLKDYITPIKHSKAYERLKDQETSICSFDEIYSYHGRTIPLEILFAITSMEEYEYFGKENSTALEALMSSIIAKLNADPETAPQAQKIIQRNTLINHLTNAESIEQFKALFLAMPKENRPELKEQDVNGFNIYVALICGGPRQTQRYMRGEVLEILEFLRDNGELTLNDLMRTYYYVPRDSGYAYTYSNNLLYSIANTFILHGGQADAPPQARTNALVASLFNSHGDSFDFAAHPDLVKFLENNRADQQLSGAVAMLDTFKALSNLREISAPRPSCN